MMRKFLTLVVVALSATCFAFAAHSDYFLQIKGADGKVLAAKTKSSSGKLQLKGLPPGVPYRCVLEIDGKSYTIEFGADIDGDGVADRTLSNVKSPRDVATGQASGKRQHSPIRFYQVLVNNEVISFKTEALAKAKCASSIKANPTAKPLCFEVVYTEKLVEYEEISFTYQKIEWT